MPRRMAPGGGGIWREKEGGERTSHHKYCACRTQCKRRQSWHIPSLCKVDPAVTLQMAAQIEYVREIFSDT